MGPARWPPRRSGHSDSVHRSLSRLTGRLPSMTGNAASLPNNCGGRRACRSQHQTWGQTAHSPPVGEPQGRTAGDCAGPAPGPTAGQRVCYQRGVGSYGTDAQQQPLLPTQLSPLKPTQPPAKSHGKTSVTSNHHTRRWGLPGSDTVFPTSSTPLPHLLGTENTHYQRAEQLKLIFRFPNPPPTEQARREGKPTGGCP